jgi:hypothetical protein
MPTTASESKIEKCETVKGEKGNRRIGTPRWEGRTDHPPGRTPRPIARGPSGPAGYGTMVTRDDPVADPSGPVTEHSAMVS